MSVAGSFGNLEMMEILLNERNEFEMCFDWVCFVFEFDLKQCCKLEINILYKQILIE